MMKVAELESEIEGLNPTQQKRLMGFLVSLQIRRDQEYRKELSRRIDQTDPNKWTTLEEIEKRYNG